MPFDYAFRSVQSTKEIRTAVDLLAKQDLGYPGYQAVWLPKAESELFSGYKRAALVYSNSVPVGNGIWQPDKQLKRIREIKHLWIDPRARGRHLAQFLVRQIESEDRQEFDALIGDTRETQTSVIRMMRDLGYQVLGKLDIYESGKKDVLLFKCFDRNLQSGLWTRAKSALRL